MESWQREFHKIALTLHLIMLTCIGYMYYLYKEYKCGYALLDRYPRCSQG